MNEKAARKSASLMHKLFSGRAFKALLIVALSVLAYLPALNCGYIWDDDYNVTHNPTLLDAKGLYRIWFVPGSVPQPQYYPLIHTSFWMEYQLWKLHPFGYHLNNVLLHAACAVLLALVLENLGLRLVWWIAALFALHPANVESVAWITERKNVLSGVFFLLAIHLYLRFALGKRSEPNPCPTGWKWYLAALIAGACSLLSKTATCPLPVVILLLIWWKREGEVWRHLFLLLPLFLVAFLLGLLTIHIEHNFVGASGREWELNLVEKILLAGRIPWFYITKTIWPHPLMFIYPRWNVNWQVWWQYLFPVSWVVVLILLWRFRTRVGKGPLTGLLYILAALGPVLGFLNVYMMRFSFVGDHLQYLAIMGTIPLVVTVLTQLTEKFPMRVSHRSGFAFGGLVLSLFGVLTWQQSKIYQNSDTLWRDTLAKNPKAWIAHANLGVAAAQQRNLEDAMKHFNQALTIFPEYEEAHTNMGAVLADQNQVDAAIFHYLEAQKINPDYAQAWYNHGLILARTGQLTNAAAKLFRAFQIRVDDPEVNYSLGMVLADLDRPAISLKYFKGCLAVNGAHLRAHFYLAENLARMGRNREAIAHYMKALRLNPGNVELQQDIERRIMTIQQDA